MTRPSLPRSRSQRLRSLRPGCPQPGSGAERSAGPSSGRPGSRSRLQARPGAIGGHRGQAPDLSQREAGAVGKRQPRRGRAGEGRPRAWPAAHRSRPPRGRGRRAGPRELGWRATLDQLRQDLRQVDRADRGPIEHGLDRGRARLFAQHRHQRRGVEHESLYERLPCVGRRSGSG